MLIIEHTDSDLKASARAALYKWATPTCQTCLSKTFPNSPNNWVETIKDRFWLWLSIVWETRKLTLYQPGVRVFLHNFSLQNTCTARNQRNLRRLERVFRCCSACETMKDYKEGHLIVWTNYISPCSSIVGLYLKGTCDVISVTMATNKVHKGVL